MARVKDLIDLYTRRCMLTGISYDLSFHHIDKAEHGGQYSIENGGILFDGIHQWHHNYCEIHDRKLYVRNNETIITYKEYFNEKPEWFNQWVHENNVFYIQKCMEYYHYHHKIGLEKKMERELDKVLTKTYNNK